VAIVRGFEGGRDGSVGIATGYGPNDRRVGVQVPVGQGCQVLRFSRKLYVFLVDFTVYVFNFPVSRILPFFSLYDENHVLNIPVNVPNISRIVDYLYLWLKCCSRKGVFVNEIEVDRYQKQKSPRIN
jgi:hypothetical protein